MNTGQMILTVGALMLLSTLVINVNRSLNNNDEFLNQTRFGLEAIALATSIIEEASQQPFDEVSWDSTKLSKDLADFTIAGMLGIDSGEGNYATFDDFDDFHNYVYAETTQQNIYNVACTVEYINSSTPDVSTTSCTYFKKLTVTISNPFSEDSVRMSYVHGYWFYN